MMGLKIEDNFRLDYLKYNGKNTDLPIFLTLFVTHTYKSIVIRYVLFLSSSYPSTKGMNPFPFDFILIY